MEGKTNFSKWIHRHFLPCCYVYSTTDAKAILMKNNLSPSEFLRPFGDYTGKSIYFNLGDRATPINDFRLDFYDSEDCNCIKKTDYSDYITSVLSDPNICPQEIKLSKEHIKSMAPKIRNTAFIWIKEFESTFIECLRFNESEIYQQPICNIYVCSSKDDPSVIDQLSSTKKQPDLVKCGLYENPDARLIIILNDKSDNSVDRQNCMKLFSKIYNSYYIMFFDINKAEEEGGTAAEIWSQYFHRVDLFNPKYKKELKVYGAFISKSEITEYKEKFYTFLIEYLFKNIKQSVTIIESILKKENKNILSWLEKPEPKGDYIDAFRVSKLKDIDKKRYTLGIIYFFFRNYDEAYKNFNKLKSGLRKDAYQTFINALYQLNVICQFMTGKDSDLNQAYKHYYKTGQYPMALRALFIEIYMNDQLGRGDLLPELIKSAKDKLPGLVFDKLIDSNKEDVNTYLIPIFNERSGIYYLLSAKQHRKFFAEMILAGFCYSKLKKKEMVYYAIHCFLLFYQFVDNISPSFTKIKEILNAKLGELCTKIDYPEAYRFFKNCIELSKYSRNKYQEYYLHEFYNTTFQAKNTPNRLGAIDNYSFSIPEIDNTTVLIIEEPDYQISKISKDNVSAFKNHNWSMFNKYAIVNKRRTHAVLSEMDLVILRLLDQMTNQYESCSNFYSRRSFRGNVNEKVYVRFKISNPLNVEIQITSMKLFNDFVPESKDYSDSTSSVSNSSISAVFKREIEYQNIQLTLPPNSYKEIELYLKPLIPGQCTIKGVEIVLNKVIDIKHYFNQKNMSKLYAHRTKRLLYSANEAGRLSSISSHSSSVISESGSGHKKAIFNHKADVTYDSISEASDIVITFPKSFDIELYENELFLMPISITNNSKYRIKRFSIFTFDLNSEEGSKTQSVYCENIFKQIDLYDDNNKVDIFAPFIPLKTGKIFLKVVFKFEDELKNKQINIRRYIIKINVLPSINFVVNEEIIRIISNEVTDKSIHFNLKAQVFIENRKSLSKLFMGSILHSDDYLINNYSDWKIISNDVYDKYYNLISLTNTKQSSNTQSAKKENRQAIKLIGGGSVENLPEEFLASQPHIARKINQVLNNNFLLFNWSACDKNNRTVNGLMLYQTNLSIPKTSAKFIKTVLSNSMNLSTHQYPFDENQTMVTIDMDFNKQNLIEIYDINYYEFFIDCKDQHLTWMGLNRYTIANQNMSNKSNNIKLQFSFVTAIKGDITINHISLSVFIKKKDASPIILNEIPYPFIVTIV